MKMFKVHFSLGMISTVCGDLTISSCSAMSPNSCYMNKTTDYDLLHKRLIIVVGKSSRIAKLQKIELKYV